MLDENKGRSWNSVCGECRHFTEDRCIRNQMTASAQDSIAAVCRCFEARDAVQDRFPVEAKE